MNTIKQHQHSNAAEASARRITPSTGLKDKRVTGFDFMRDPMLNFSTSVPIEKRDELGLTGLLPPNFVPLEQNVERCIRLMREKSTDLEKYIYLQNIQDIDERLYYAILVKYTEEVTPIVYTPTVGEACQKFSSIYRGTPRGMFISIQEKGRIRQVLDAWPRLNVTTIVVTDGERILGLGDLGINGIGIAIGKLSLYTAFAGIHPSNVLPVVLDVGTENEQLLQDPLYLGLSQRRVRGTMYDEFVEEFFSAAQDKFGEHVLIQFEDFGNKNAFRLLRNLQNKACTFNDDIQGTAAVILGGLLASETITHKPLSSHRFLFAGAGEAGTGIAELIAYAISIETGVSIGEARKKIFLVDSKGLVTKQRFKTLQEHKRNYAHDVDDAPDLLSSVYRVKPTALIGVSAMPRLFNLFVCKEMASMNERPIIFALSNPTTKAECSAEEAYSWTDGKVVFASGSPFDPVEINGKTFYPGQGNNALVFPGIGLGVQVTGSRRITTHDMLIAAKTLAGLVGRDDVNKGRIYPSISKVRKISAAIACKIAENAYATKVATKPRPGNILKAIQAMMYDPFA